MSAANDLENPMALHTDEYWPLDEAEKENPNVRDYEGEDG